MSTYDNMQETSQWYGAIPSHWHQAPLGSSFVERRSKVSDKDYAALSVTKHGIVPQLDTAAKTDDGDNRKLVLSGDFVINSRSDRKGSSGVSPQDGSVSLINTVLTPRSAAHTPYINHLLRSVPFQEEFYRFGTGIVADLWSTKFSSMKGILIALPPRDEQIAIAAFLDHETDKIDNLIDEQEQLIALLDEKRQAVISHAVTKGLDPDVEMKDSGIEWLGEVPAHWHTSPIKHLYHVTAGQSPKSEDCNIDGIGLPFLQGCAEFGNNNPIPTQNCNHPPKVCRVGDVLMSVRAPVGQINLADQAYGIGRGLCALRPRMGNTDYLRYALHSAVESLNSVSTGTTYKAVSTEQVGNVCFPNPPHHEQNDIANFLNDEVGKINNLSVEARMMSSLLKERRSTLISAAVTGKIDVRNHPAAVAALNENKDS